MTAYDYIKMIQEKCNVITGARCDASNKTEYAISDLSKDMGHVADKLKYAAEMYQKDNCNNIFGIEVAFSSQYRGYSYKVYSYCDVMEKTDAEWILNGFSEVEELDGSENSLTDLFEEGRKTYTLSIRDAGKTGAAQSFLADEFAGFADLLCDCDFVIRFILDIKKSEKKQYRMFISLKDVKSLPIFIRQFFDIGLSENKLKGSFEPVTSDCKISEYKSDLSESDFRNMISFMDAFMKISKIETVKKKKEDQMRTQDNNYSYQYNDDFAGPSYYDPDMEEDSFYEDDFEDDEYDDDAFSEDTLNDPSYNEGDEHNKITNENMSDSGSIFEMTLDEMELSVRSYNCLKRAGFDTVGDIANLTDDELRKIRNLGEKSVNEIKNRLNELGLNKPAATQGSGMIREIAMTQEPAVTALEKLEKMIGLKSVKKQIKKIAAFAKMKKDFEQRHIQGVSMSMNMCFTGNPGTAKTTVARLLSEIFYEFGLVKNKEIVECGRADLVGKYVGQTAPKIKEIFGKAKGKVLFIDEAYSLSDGTGDGYSEEAISTILAELENNRENVITIFAGYPDKMKEFMDSNPGLRSRIQFTVDFPDYSEEEMVDIAELEAEKRGFAISEKAKDKIIRFCNLAKNSTESGNGRYVRNLVETATLNYAYRVYGNDKEIGTAPEFLLMPEDFEEEITFKAEEKRIIGF